MHILVLAAALVVLLCLPCIVAVIICADELFDRAAWTRRRRREDRALRRLDRSLDTAGQLTEPDRSNGTVPAPRVAAGPAIEQIAADLRRLDRQRHGGVTTGSATWLAAVLRAYDDRLTLASRCLGVSEHLHLLEGIDREIERVRVEGQLQAAGLALRSVAHRPPDRLP
jgi:hypothetical protein